MARADRFLVACRGGMPDTTPIWLMRQAGRYMAEYHVVRTRAGGFLQMCKTPDAACEVTLQPVDALGVDAAILFSDILVPVEAMGMKLVFDEHGPGFPDPVRDEAAVRALRIPEVEQDLGYVMEAVKKIRVALDGRVPLIGFAGAPWTLMAYAVEGGGSRNFDVAKKLMYTRPDVAHLLLDKLARTQAAYLLAQVKAGAQAIQLFDSWAGALDAEDFATFAAPYAKQVLDALKGAGVPRIYFVLDGNTRLREIQQCGADVVGLDWRIGLADARRILGDTQAVQGNLDPCALLGDVEHLRRKARGIITENARRPGHVFNLGHGILPTTPVENARALVEIVHEAGAAA